jgi:Trk K+ transport system NAD-binding subunit
MAVPNVEEQKTQVILCGLGQVGYRVATLLLDLGEELTVVTMDSRSEWTRDLKRRGATIVAGDARDETVLQEAGLARAKAIIGCIHDDTTNIEIALDARRFDPSMRTIARIVDPGLARQAEKHLGVHRAIAMTAAAAPAFAAATYGDHVLTEFTVKEEKLLALKVQGPHKLHERPLVVISPQGICELQESKELKQDQIAVVITQGESMSDKVPKANHKHSMLRALHPAALFKFIGGVWSHTSIQMKGIIISIFVLIAVSIGIFMVGMKLSFIDSVYFVVTTATTVGYGDISPKDANTWVKVFSCFMMLVSAAGMAVLFSMVTDYILTARLMQLVGRHHVPERGHIILVGVGTVGHRVAEELHRLKAHLVVVDRNDANEYVATLRTRMPVVVGDAREPDTLIRAGIMHAKAIITTTASDAINLSVGLTAKELNSSVRAVLSIFDVDFAHKIQSIPEFDVAMSPPLLAAPAFVGAALYDNAIASFRVGRHFFTLCDDPKGEVEFNGARMSLEIKDLIEG